MKIKTIISEDEFHARERLKSLLSSFTDISICAEACDGDELLHYLQKNNVDLAVCDINMPGANVFNIFSSLANPPLVIFQTAYSEFGPSAFEIEAIDYLVKPFPRERLAKALDKVRTKLAPDKTPEQQTITVKKGNAIEILRAKDIHMIAVIDGLCFIYTEQGRFLADKTLSQYETLLARKNFYRTSREAIVNCSFIQKIHPMFSSSYKVELKNGTKVHLSRRRAPALIERLSSN